MRLKNGPYDSVGDTIKTAIFFLMNVHLLNDLTSKNHVLTVNMAS